MLDRGGPVSHDEQELLQALRAGDESAFSTLVAQHYSTMIRVAAAYVKDRPAAEEVVQETWLGVLRGLDRYEARSSLKTWIFGILANQARSRAQKERRLIPFSALSEPAEAAETAVGPERFLPADHPRWPRWWAEYPRNWDEVPEDRLLARETRAVVDRAIENLPANQRSVITLRDIEGLTAEETCSVLELSETNQRVLLHRARSRVRRELERYLTQEDT